MYVIIINYKTRRQNIVTEIIMNLHYSSGLKNVKFIVKLKLKLRKACSITL